MSIIPWTRGLGYLHILHPEKGEIFDFNRVKARVVENRLKDAMRGFLHKLE